MSDSQHGMSWLVQISVAVLSVVTTALIGGFGYVAKAMTNFVSRREIESIVNKHGPYNSDKPVIFEKLSNLEKGNEELKKTVKGLEESSKKMEIESIRSSGKLDTIISRLPERN